MTITDLINAMGNARDPGSARCGGAPVRAEDPRAPERPVTGLGGGQAARLGGERRAPDQPRTSGSVGQLRAERRDQDHGCLVAAVDQIRFQPVLGPKLLGEIERHFTINDPAGHGASGEHLGSAWDVGFYGIVQKDLRAALRCVSGEP